MDSPLALALTLLLGAVLGGAAVLAWRLSGREQTVVPPQPEPLVPAGVASVLQIMRSSTMLVDENDAVVKASALSYVLGVIDGDRIASNELAHLVGAVRRDGQVRDVELELSPQRGRLRYVQARVAPLNSRLMLVTLDDHTQERRVESIRRDFVANVSHELKTPVGALNLLAEATAEAKDDPEAVQRFSTRMQVEAERLTRLVQQIIELSRLQGDTLVDEPVEVDVDQLVTRAIERSSIDAEAKDITLVTQAGTGLSVLGNPEQIGVAIGNLVENAVAYSPDASRVAVTAARHGDMVDVTVTDQGIGIPESELDRIFERFYRVDPARARSTGGTGLGLSIVKHVAASHGGDIKVWSVQNEGSSFTLSLPALASLVDDTEVESALPAPAPTPADPSTTQGTTLGTAPATSSARADGPTADTRAATRPMEPEEARP